MKKIYISLIFIALIIANLPYLIKWFENLQASKAYNKWKYEIAFQLFPEDNIWFYNKANSLYKLGKYRQAIEYYTWVNFNNKRQYYILHNLWNSYFKLGEQSEKTNAKLTIQNRLASINFYQKALEIWKKFKISENELKETKNNLDYVLNKLKQLQKKQKNKENQQNNSQWQNSQNPQNKENSKSKQNQTQQNIKNNQRKQWQNNNSQKKENNTNTNTKKSNNQQKNNLSKNWNQNKQLQNKQKTVKNNKSNSTKYQNSTNQNSNYQKQFEQQIQQYIQQLNQQQKYYMKYYNKKYQPKNDNPFNIQIIDPITGQPIFDNEVNQTQKDW